MTRQQATQILEHAGMAPDRIDQFLAWHLLHRNAWKAFEMAALARIAAGATRLGAKALGEDIRGLLGKSGDYAINNNHLAAFGRLFAAKYPQHEKLFEFRRLTSAPAAVPHWQERAEA